MVDHKIASRKDWLEARKALLVREKAFDKERDALARSLRDLPWVAVEENYVFEGADGAVTLGDLFDGRRQLIIQHFMFGPDWDEGCPSCSFWADGFDPMIVHLNHRDTSFALVSRAPIENLLAYRKRMGWHMTWVSSLKNQFNFDYRVSATEAEMAAGRTHYNYRACDAYSQELPGVSAFYKDRDGTVYHTYSTYARGLDRLNVGYHLLDITAKGRDEDDLSYTQAWIRRHDEYDRGDA